MLDRQSTHYSAESLTKVTLDHVQLANHTSCLELPINLLSLSIAKLKHLQKVTITTVKDMAVSLQELERAVQGQGA